MQVTQTNPSAYSYQNSLPSKEISSHVSVDAVRERSEYSSESTTKVVGENSIQRSEVSVNHTYERLSLYSTTATRLKENSPVNADVAVNAVDDRSTNAAANTILKFIENRIKQDVAEGASSEEIESRLQAGLEGFKKGFNEAKGQLEALGVFNGEDSSIEEAIKGTYNSVLSGIESLREKFVEKNDTTSNVAVIDNEKNEAMTNKNPILSNVSSTDAALVNNFATLTSHYRFDAISSHEKKADVPVMESSSRTRRSAEVTHSTFHRQQGIQNSFSFQVETADGDKVTITAKTTDVTATKYSLFNTPMWDNEQLARVNNQDSLFSIGIDGDLDDEELNAIGDLLNKIENLSVSFFEGDLDLAFNQASNMGYDANEIVGFSLNLKHVEIEKVRATYQEFLPASHDQNKQAGNLLDKLQSIGSFAKDLIDAAQIASTFKESHSLIVDLVRNFEVEPSDENVFSNRFSSFGILNSYLKVLSPSSLRRSLTTKVSVISLLL